MTSSYALINDLSRIYICKYYPFLQELPLDTMNTLRTFDYPLLVRIEVLQLPLKMALQTLNQCPNLRIFSTEIQIDVTDQSMAASSTVA